MLKKTVNYVDFDGNEQSEDVYFNLSKSELTKLEMRESIIKGDEVTGGLRNRIRKVMDGGSGREIIELVETVIRESVGKRSEDGRRFEKSDDISNDFMNSAVYDAVFMELVTDADAAAKFINAILPADISGQVEEAMANDPEFATHQKRLQAATPTPAPDTTPPSESAEPASNVVTPDPHTAELTDEERAILERLQKKMDQ